MFSETTIEPSTSIPSAMAMPPSDIRLADRPNWFIRINVESAANGREAVAADPENPRLNYQLGRAYGYSGMGEEAMPYRLKALEKDYPQSLFVIGYLYLLGRTIEQDTCPRDPFDCLQSSMDYLKNRYGD